MTITSEGGVSSSVGVGSPAAAAITYAAIDPAPTPAMRPYDRNDKPDFPGPTPERDKVRRLVELATVREVT